MAHGQPVQQPHRIAWFPQSLAEPEKVKHAIAVAERGLSDLQSYSGARQAGSNFDLFLKGATT